MIGSILASKYFQLMASNQVMRQSSVFRLRRMDPFGG